MLLHISGGTVGKNFRLLNPGVDTVCKTDQFLSMLNGKWSASTYSKKEGFKNANCTQHYRRAINIIGRIEVYFTIVKKYCNKIFD